MIWLILFALILLGGLLEGQRRIRETLGCIERKLDRLPGGDGAALTELADELDRDTEGLKKSVSDNAP